MTCEYCGLEIERDELGWSWHFNGWAAVHHHDECLEMFEGQLNDD